MLSFKFLKNILNFFNNFFDISNFIFDKLRNIEKFESKKVLFTKQQAVEFAKKIIDIEIEEASEENVKVLETVKNKISVENFDDLEIPFGFEEDVACISLNNIDNVINSLCCENE